MVRTNEKIDQTFKGSLKNDPDKKNPKHGLACEYLFEKLREKQYLKEIVWLKVNLKNEYRTVVVEKIKELIRQYKKEKEEIKSYKETLFTLKVEQDNLCNLDWDGMDDETFKKEIEKNNKIERRIEHYEREIERLNEHFKISSHNIKQFLECRATIFRLLSQLRNPIFLQCFKKVIYDKHVIPSRCIEAPINSLTLRGRRTNSVIGFADVLIPYSNLSHAEVSYRNRNYKGDNIEINIDAHIFYFIEKDTLQVKEEYDHSFFSSQNVCKYRNCTLGEVKISKQTAEDVLQQINQYHEYVTPSQTFVCLDYEDVQLKNLAKNSKIEVVKLGQKFIEFCENRPVEEIEEI
jgi:hypothetical protein